VPATTSAVVGSARGRGGGGIVAAESSRLRKAGEVHSSDGCQTLKKPIRHAMQISEAPISTIQGLTKLEIKNWGTAKETPQTRIAGQICNHAPPAGKGADQPGRHDQREERQLPPDHRTQQIGSSPVTLARPASACRARHRRRVRCWRSATDPGQRAARSRARSAPPR